ncbi:MAG: hypothetical protein H0X34_12370 [Chthoniobacterales bacterium]|nr:hypothetical protein [Chthoniobacterales bacterium]
MTPYRLVLESAVLHFVLARRLAERRFIIRTFDALAADPYRHGDYQEKTSAGREMEVILIGKYIITYWADHAVKELRIVRAEIV